MWTTFANILLGLWLMAAPGILGYGAAASDSGHIAGPLIVTFSTIALWEATYAVEKWNLPIAVWLLLAPWILGYDSPYAIVSDMATAVLVLLFSLHTRKITQNFGGGWTSLWKKGTGE